MRYCDLHCDTALALYAANASIADAHGCVSLQKAECFTKYIQAMAVFTSPRLSDEDGWNRFRDVRRKLLTECAMYRIPLLCDSDAYTRFHERPSSSDTEKRVGFVLTVEDGRILAGNLARVQMLFDAGVRILTPLWGGETCMGGSHESAHGLSDFGKAAVRECFRCGIAVDLSHASPASADDILHIAETNGGRVLATHSNAFSVCAHSRNLTDDRIRRIAALGGVIGLNLYTAFLKDQEPWSIEDLLPHLDHIVSLVGVEHTAIGADWDGADFPPDCADISMIPHAAQLVREHGYTEAEADCIFYTSAYNFLRSL